MIFREEIENVAGEVATRHCLKKCCFLEVVEERYCWKKRVVVDLVVVVVEKNQTVEEMAVIVEVVMILREVMAKMTELEKEEEEKKMMMKNLVVELLVKVENLGTEQSQKAKTLQVHELYFFRPRFTSKYMPETPPLTQLLVSAIGDP